ncbi:TIGR04076 family protein [candidate division WOR-3 bacterium]|nr:TIGR04076 family protein [candidate division WOR-3 bacterium]
MKLKIKVKEITGNCPVYKIGDEFFIEDGYKLNSEIKLCMHSLSSIMPYYIPLSHNISPKKLGLSQNKTSAYIQCLDPCKYTNGGTVIFEITQV